MVPSRPIDYDAPVQRSSEYFKSAVQKADAFINKFTSINILKISVDDTLEHIEDQHPDVIIIDGNGSTDTSPIKGLLSRLGHIEVPKILLLNKGATGIDLIKHYVDHIVFGQKDAERLARTFYMNRE